MKVTIIVFSPSGNTAGIASLLQQRFERRDVAVQLLNITGNPQFFKEGDIVRFLRENVDEHDLLCIGGPVYAHHLQYHMLDLLRALPKPGNGWGKIAFPFVTYGGICSGIALEEAGELLVQSGRTVLAGMKVAMPHTMTRAFMDQPVNHDLPGDGISQVLDDAIERILATSAETSCLNQAESLKYQSRELVQKANTVFIEKVWHAERYPNVAIDSSACANCGQCARVCPVAHLVADSSGCVEKCRAAACIHCFNCVMTCPVKAISLPGDLEQARAFMTNMMRNGNETPGSAVYPTQTNNVR